MTIDAGFCSSLLIYYGYSFKWCSHPFPS